MSVIIQILEIVIIPILGALGGLLISFINKKKEEIDIDIENNQE